MSYDDWLDEPYQRQLEQREADAVCVNHQHRESVDGELCEVCSEEQSLELTCPPESESDSARLIDGLFALLYR